MTVVLREDLLGDARGTTLAAGLSAGAATLTVAAGGLATWTPVTFGRIPVVIARGDADEEHLYATGVSGDTLTGLVRGQDDTADQAHASGATVEHGLFASHVDAPNEFLSAPTAKGQIAASAGADEWGVTTAGADGTVPVYDSTSPTGLDARDELTGFTLTDPIIPALDWAAATHTHVTSATGGQLGGATPSSSEPNDTGSVGTAATGYSYGDHAHEREDFALGGVLSTSTPGDGATAGTDDTVPRGDHVHGREPWGDPVALSTSTAAPVTGVEEAVPHADHGHPWPAEAPRGNVATNTIDANTTAVVAETVVSGLGGSWVGTNRRLRLRFSGEVFGTGVTNALAVVRIRNGTDTSGTELRKAPRLLTVSGGQGQEALEFSYTGVFTGAQEFVVTVERAAGTGSVGVAATASSKAEFTIDDIGD